MVIYKINFPNGKYYIGKTKNPLGRRVVQHKSDSKRLKYSNSALYNAYRKYNITKDNFEIIEYCGNLTELDNREIFWIDYYNTYLHSVNSKGYNSTLGGDGGMGKTPSKETRDKLSKALLGRKKSKETVLAMSLAQKGRKKSPEQVEFMRKFKLDNPVDPACFTDIVLFKKCVTTTNKVCNKYNISLSNIFNIKRLLSLGESIQIICEFYHLPNKFVLKLKSLETCFHIASQYNLILSTLTKTGSYNFNWKRSLKCNYIFDIPPMDDFTGLPC